MRARVLIGLVALAVAASGSFTSSARPNELRCRGTKPTLTGTPGDDVLVGTRGRDVIAGGGGDDVIKGRGGGDLVCGNGGADTISGGKGRRAPHSNPGSELLGGPGDDVVTGGDFTDFLDGGAGSDTVHGRGGGDYIHGYVEIPTDSRHADGDDRLFGGDGNDSFNAEGGRPPDYCCSPDPGDDELHGGDGVDVMAGGSGSDVIDGGKGADWASFESAVVADLSVGTATLATDTDVLVAIENLQGSELGDTLVGDDGPNHFSDSHEYEVIDHDTIRGLGGNDVVETGLGNDVVEGGDGDDYIGILCCIEGAEDEDAFYGGPGADRLGGAISGPDHFDGGEGIDLIEWTSVDDRSVTADLTTGTAEVDGVTSTLVAIEELTGGFADDFLFGDGGPNVLLGRNGNDHLDGREGIDVLQGGPGGRDVCVNGETVTGCEQ